MAIAFSLSSAALVFSVDSQHGTIRDHSSKEAIAAADAGANVALERLNQFGNALTSGSPCLGLSGGTLVLSGAQTDGWCPEITGTVGEGSYSYRVGPTKEACAANGGERCVVAIGTAGGVSRRIAVSLGTSTTHTVLENAGVIGVEGITLENNTLIRVGVGTNGNVNLSNGASICGNIRYGVGKEVTFSNSSSQCSGYTKAEGNESLPPVSSFMPQDIASNNSDYRLVRCTGTNAKGEPQPAGCQSDSYSKKWGSTVPWNASTRTMSTDQNASLTLTGGDYFVCRLVLSNNSHLIIGYPAKVRIFFDTPEDCGLSAGAEQISVSNNADITDSGYQASEGKFDMPGLYVMGSATIPTSISFSNNTGTTNEFVLYAPNTNIVFDNNATYKGVVAGKTVTMRNQATVEQDSGYVPPQLGGAKIFARQSYVECIGGTVASPPDASC